MRPGQRKPDKNFRSLFPQMLCAALFLGFGGGIFFALRHLILQHLEVTAAKPLLYALAAGILSLSLLGVGLFLWQSFKLGNRRKKETRARPVSASAVRHRLLPSQVNLDEVAELDLMIQSSLKQFDRQLENQKQFVANAIHELNTPAALLRLSIDSYRKRMADAKIFDYVFMDTLDHATARIEKLIKQIETLDADPEQESYSLIDVPDLLHQVENMVLKIAAHKEIEIHEEVLGSEELYSNRSFLQSILLNLLDNAIKYSPEGRTISVLADAQEDGCKFVVQDQGIGIAEKDLPHVLKRFYRTNQAHARKAGGSGLGLAITDEMVRKLGGKLMIESEIGKGTTVSFWIPNSRAAAESPE